jgi:hypothetical protein
MVSPGLAGTIVISSLLVCVIVYVRFSVKVGSFVNILTPLFVIQIPANFLLQLAYIQIFGTEYSTYAYCFVYGTLAIKSIAFVRGYGRGSHGYVRPPGRWSERHFFGFSLTCLTLSGATYAPVLFEFREYIFDPREIYRLTRTGYGQATFVSSTLAYLAIVFIIFSTRKWLTKTLVVGTATGLLVMHGSKGQIMDVIFLVLLFQVFLKGRKIPLLRALVYGLGMAAVVVGLFALTMPFEDGLQDATESISQYSDYTRNAMLVIDSHMPAQYGRLTAEANIYGIVPRVLVPSKPKNFGSFYLVEQFYPDWFDADTGSPDFGIGVQYADFGAFAVVYIALFAMLEGYLARVFVRRLEKSKHPADFLLVAFFAGVSVLPLGGAGWLFPEVWIIGIAVWGLSRIGLEDRDHSPGQRPGTVNVAQA